MVDLHVHSTCSDGTFTPEELVDYAMEKIERIMKTERHTITEPHARRLIKYILHKNLLVYWQTEDFLNKCKFSLCEK